MLWLAAADGLYRFDGFHYHKIAAYPFGSARFLGFTRDGSLWCGGVEGLARASGGRFEILLRDEVQAFAALPDAVFARGAELVRIALDGSVRHYGRPTRRDLLPDSTGRIWGVCLRPESACWLDSARPAEIPFVDIPHGFTQAAPDSGGGVWAADLDRAVLLKDGRPVRTLQRLGSRETRRSGPLVQGRNELWFVGETVRGLTSGIEFRDSAAETRWAPVSGFEDSRSHLWVGAAGRGLVEWIPHPDWGRWYPEQFDGGVPIQLVQETDGAVVLATEAHLYRFDPSSDRWTRLTSVARRYDAVLPLGNGGFLASVRGTGLLRLDRKGHVAERPIAPTPGPMDFRKIARDQEGTVWVGSKSALMRLEGSPGALRLRPVDLPEIPPGSPAQAVDFDVDSAGRLWVGYDAGVASLEGGRWVRLATDSAAAGIRSLTFAGPDIWLAHRRPGAFSRIRGAKVESFAAAGGFGPVDSHFLKSDSRGWIWRGSPEGLHVSDGRSTGPDDWIHLHRGNGLAFDGAGQYGFLDDGKNVWAAGAEGVSRLRPDPRWFDAAPSTGAPAVTRVEADGQVFLFPSPLPTELPAGVKVLRMDFGGLASPPFRDRPLRYRLEPLESAWTFSADGSVEYRDLRAGNYKLEVGWTGQSSSISSVYGFRIGPAAPVGSRLWPLGFLAGAAAFVPFLLRRGSFERAVFRLQKARFLLRRRWQSRSGGRYSSPAEDEDFSGQIFCGRYRLSRAVSRGGFSVVYEAFDLRRENERLAVKVLAGGGGEGWLRDRFAYEVAALRSVRHPGIVPILDSWIGPAGQPCLAMPFLQGPTLRAALDRGTFPPPRAARVLRQVGSALAAVHERGIVHRDLKPENLILLCPGSEDEQAVIIDFGTAALRLGDNELGATTLMAGSFHYMAPERLTGRYAPASDVYSLGVIVLEMLAGKRLADLNATFSDGTFQAELERILSDAFGTAGAATAAAALAPAFDPEPRRRPVAVEPWAHALASAIHSG